MAVLVGGLWGDEDHLSTGCVRVVLMLSAT